MNNKPFKLESAGVREVLKSAEIQSQLTEYANQVKQIANGGSGFGGYDSDIYVGKNRANASVFALQQRAIKDNLENNTLLKALGSIRGS